MRFSLEQLVLILWLQDLYYSLKFVTRKLWYWLVITACNLMICQNKLRVIKATLRTGQNTSAYVTPHIQYYYTTEKYKTTDSLFRWLNQAFSITEESLVVEMLVEHGINVFAVKLDLINNKELLSGRDLRDNDVTLESLPLLPQNE